jgi:hypothetical protein
MTTLPCDHIRPAASFFKIDLRLESTPMPNRGLPQDDNLFQHRAKRKRHKPHRAHVLLRVKNEERRSDVMERR